MRYEILDFRLISISNLRSQVSILNTHISILAFLILFSGSAFSQGLTENNLSSNAVLINNSSHLKSKSNFRASSIADTISLGVKGIVDDFSYLGSYPDSSIWMDNYVFINRGYGKSPPTIGVATFDGLNEKGYPYNFVVANASSFGADSLTSKPIDLGGLFFDDSIYFSFYYQPQGLGEKPEALDSLVLEFKAPGTTSNWNHIWSQKGKSLTDSSWIRVMVLITDPIYLQKGFQFRFRNYATLSGNLDHWNIDYVYLNKLRSKIDTVFKDISWEYNGSYLLKTYSAMPWKQYNQSELRTSIVNLMNNNDTVTHNINYDYKITNDATSSTIGTFNGAANILPFRKQKMYTQCDTSLGCFNSVAITPNLFPLALTAPSQFTIQHHEFTLGGDFIAFNDTLTVHQEFSNYYAYDDGSAESALGINILDAQLAEKFVLNVQDTLQCVDIYFNPVVTNATLYAFYLHVWTDNGGQPGSLIYTSGSVLSPMYEQQGQDKFSRYFLDSPLLLSPGAFYIGFTQKTDQFLNVGEDKNVNSMDKIFWNKGAGKAWQTSSYPGSLMMHPLLGARPTTVGIAVKTPQQNAAISIYPNPANDKLFIKSNSENTAQKIDFEIVDLYGRTIITNSMNVSESGTYGVDISGITEGIYFIRTTIAGNSETTKFIKIN